MPAHRGKRVSEAEFRRLYLDKSKTLAQVGSELGISPRSVQHRAKARGLPLRSNSKAHIAKVGPDQFKLFKAMWEGGVVAKDIARHFGMTYQIAARTAQRFGLAARTRSLRKISLEQWHELVLPVAMQARAKVERKAWKEAWGRQDSASAA